MGDVNNEWIIDKGYGSGVVLGFRGAPEFIEQSKNFVRNYLIGPTASITELFGNFCTVITDYLSLQKAIFNEQYNLYMAALIRDAPRIDYQDEDYPPNFIEECEAYMKEFNALVFSVAAKPEDFKSLVNPADEFPPYKEEDWWEDAANQWASERMNLILSTIREEAFMPRYFNNNSDQEHGLFDLLAQEA
jgi:hypothetical protein